MGTFPLPALRRPLWQGAVLGFSLPLLVVAPTVLAGRFSVLQTQLSVYGLLPILSLLAVPSGLAASVLQRAYGARPALWRLCTGFLLGGSTAGALLLASTTPDYAPAHRAVLSVFGGVLLVGFWLWLGALLGGYLAYERRHRAAPGDISVPGLG